MNYYQPRELKNKEGKPTGKWHFTCMNDDNIWAVGYCREHDGHDNEKEASECYKKYLINNRLTLMIEQDVMKRCIVCKEWTPFYATIDMQTWRLCKNHNIKEKVEELFEAPMYIISSY